MSPLPPAASGPVPGEVLHFSRGFTTAAILCGLWGLLVLLASAGVFCMGYTEALPPHLRWLPRLLGVLGPLAAGSMLWDGWYVATHKPYLVLGQERLQYWEGRHRRWEVSYGHIREITAFRPAHPLFGARVPWVPCLGFRWADPEAFDQAHPRLAGRWRRFRERTGFDCAVPLVYTCEPQERYVEAVLRCYHRFQGGQEEVRPLGC